MFYRIPVEAAEENWICFALNAALLDGFDRADRGQIVAPWPDCLPEEHREALKRRRKLGKSVFAVVEAYKGLAPAERAMVRSAREDQLELAELFDGARAALTSAQLPAGIRASLAEFADRVFDTLDELGVRERSYAIHDRQNRLACAFCGYEAADNSRERRMDWDHYLARTLYPFAGANLRNLSPMGDACNGSFKKAKDMLRDDASVRRLCFDPYASEPVIVNLLQSTLFVRGPGRSLPNWVVSMTGDADRCKTWDAVFALRTRWIARLDQIYRGCLAHFGILYGGDTLTDAELVNRLSRLSHPKGYDAIAPGGFLAAAVFGLLADRSAAVGAEAERLRRLLRRFLKGPTVAD